MSSFTQQSRRLAVAAIPLLAISIGCRSQCGDKGIDRCADIPPGAIPQPAGTFACQWQNAHSALADQDHFVIYEHEWYRGGRELGPFGTQHVDQLARNLPNFSNQVVVESHYDTSNNRVDRELDEARRQVVVQALVMRGIPDADQRVIVGTSRAEGLYGQEAARIGERRLQGGGQGGLGGGGFGGGGFGGGGFGGVGSGGGLY